MIFRFYSYRAVPKVIIFACKHSFKTIYTCIIFMMVTYKNVISHFVYPHTLAWFFFARIILQANAHAR
ncbi:hypothetical protein BJL95_02025 [Methylomonas sp. LWB]|nr:hypothetical protein BJL95_02025 [Methylomonas sp. LWB]